MGGFAQAEAEGQGQIEGRAGTTQGFRHLRGQAIAFAGNAHDRDDIGIAFTIGGIEGHAFFTGIGAYQRNEGDIFLFQRRTQRTGFLMRQVGHAKTVHAAAGRITGQVFVAVLQKGVNIAHKHHPGLDQALAFAQGSKDAAQAHAVAEGAPRGLFHHRAVGHGVGKGHAYFNDVRAVFVQFHKGGPKGAAVGETGGEKGDQGRTTFGVGGADFLFKQMHGYTSLAAVPRPRALVTMPRSLSPRPERLTTT